MSQSVIVKNKEIRVKNPQMVIEDENRAELIEFTITNANSIEGVDGMKFYVQFKNKLGEVGMDTLVNPLGEVHNDMLVLDWLPSATFSKERGKVDIQIVGFTESLVATTDTTYQSGKLYFSDSTGTFLPVYPSTSEHTPKVGETILGTVYENQITGDDHRWSTEKCLLNLPENIYDNGTPVYTEEQVKNLITQMNEQVLLAQTYASDAEGYMEQAETYKEQAEGAKDSASESATDANAYKLDAENARDKAQEWATKTNGKVDNVDYSAKHYANEAGDYAEDADNARIVSVSETQSPDDGGTNVVVITYKDNTTFTFFVKNGHTGTPFTIYKTYSSIAEMTADFANVPEGRFVIISSSVSDPDNSKMYVRGAEAFTFVTDLSGAQGIQGPAGQAATITVGTVSTGAAGSSASIVNSGTSSAAVFDFVIPRGDKGEQGIQGEQGIPGPTPVITIGSVTYGDTPTVTIDTTDPANPVMNFVLKTSEVGVVDNLNSSSSVDALSARQGSVLKNALDSTNARVENLEQEHGSYQEVTVKSPYTIPSGKAKNWSVNVLRGVSRAKKQLWNINTPLTSPNMNNYQHSGFSFSWHDTANNNNYIGLRITPSHKYCLSIKNTTALPLTLAFFDTYVFLGTVPANSIFSTVVDAPSTAIKTILFCAESWTGDRTLSAENFIVTDLTFYFNGTIPSNAQTIADIQTNYPELLVPSAYGQSLLSTTYEGVRSKGVNIWDEQYEVGFIDTSTGANTAANDAIRSKDFISVNAGETLYCYAPNCETSAKRIRIYFYGYDESFINSASMDNLHTGNGYGSGQFDIPIGCAYIRFTTANQSTPVTYNHDIQICLNSYADKTTYHPYMTDTLTLPTPITLRSAGTVAEEFDLETGKVTRPVGVASNLGSYTWMRRSDGLLYTSTAVLTDAYNSTLNVQCANYLPPDADHYGTSTQEGHISISSGGYIYVMDNTFATADAFKTAMANVALYYELATPNAPTQLDPIQNPYLATESGGTISSILTDAVDDSMTLGYINL